MLKVSTSLFVCASALMVGSVWAQDMKVSETDKSFLMKDARGASYELDAAKLAVTKAIRQDIKHYAEKLVQDHEKYNSELEQLGKSAALTLSTEPDQADVAHMEDLKRLSGSAFDTLFIKEMQRVNADDKQDADKEKTVTHSEMIKSFIAKFAETDAEHEKLANQLARSNG